MSVGEHEEVRRQMSFASNCNVLDGKNLPTYLIRSPDVSAMS